MVSHGHGVVSKAFHDLQLGDAHILLEHEVTHEHVAGMQKHHVRLGHPVHADECGDSGHSAPGPVAAGVLGTIGQKMGMGVVDMQDGQGIGLRLSQREPKQHGHDSDYCYCPFHLHPLSGLMVERLPNLLPPPKFSSYGNHLLPSFLPFVLTRHSVVRSAGCLRSSLSEEPVIQPQREGILADGFGPVAVSSA